MFFHYIFVFTLSAISYTMGMLKNIPHILSPDLLHVLASMGHGDLIVLADSNFPAASVCKDGAKEIRADGLNIPDLLDAILQLIPLDTYTTMPVILMGLEDSDKELEVPVWESYQTLLNKHEGKPIKMTTIGRHKFYEISRKAFAVVATGETALYGNIILQKGVISTPQTTSKPKGK